MIPCFQKEFPYVTRLEPITSQTPPLITNKVQHFKKKEKKTSTQYHREITQQISFTIFLPFWLRFERFFIKPGRVSQTDFSRSPSRTWLLVSWQRAAFLLCLLSSDKCWLELINALLSSCEFLVRAFVLKFHG